MKRALLHRLALVFLAVAGAPLTGERARGQDAPGFVDLSLLVDASYPCTWPTFPQFHIHRYRQIGPASAYNGDILTIDGNTGTQLDVPPHSIPRPGTGLPHAGPLGSLFTDKVAAWQLVGEACVIDVRELRDGPADGQSRLVEEGHIAAWEKKHRRLRFGDVVLLRSDYTDTYYRPFPEGRRFAAEPVGGTSPAWPDPTPECMEYLASRGVMAVGTDSPSMGPLPDLAAATHLAGLRHGMVFTEGATGLGKLPATGSFYCFLGPRHADGPYGEGRAFAIAPGPLARRLIEAAREKRVVDLSVVLSKDLPVTWPGAGVGNHRHPYLRIDFLYAADLDLFHHGHMLDSHAGTHLVPPAYALPPAGFDDAAYAPEVRAWLAAYERAYGPRGTSDLTAEQVPISWTCGRARVIDVRHLVGTTVPETWPASPEITPNEIAKHEKEHGALERGDVVIFRSGHTDRLFRPLPAGEACMVHPLNGKSEGWPAPGADAIVYLAEKGIRCVATDGPTLGGVEPRRALMTYWALGSRGMVGVEFLTAVGSLPEGAHFLFAAVKIAGCHGGPGRAIGLY